MISVNVADDDVAAAVDDYMRLIVAGLIDADSTRFYISQLRFSKPNDQYCIATQKGIDELRFLRSYDTEG